MVARISILLPALICIQIASAQPVFINEFMASNSGMNPDPDFGGFPDWIELYNAGDSTVDLSGYYLSDNLGNGTKWQIPDGIEIKSRSFLVFMADGMDTCRVYCHTSFRLEKSGEEIGLFDPHGIPVDSIEYDFQQTDVSYGRQPDGGPDWYYFEHPSFNGSNVSSAFTQTPAVEFSLEAGFYNSKQALELNIDDPAATIRYTLDGSDPSLNSAIYSGPITVRSRAGEANNYSMIRTNEDPYHWLPDWLPPVGEVFKATVVKARGYKEGSRPGDIITRTYFVDSLIQKRYPDIAVISLVSDPDNLFNDTTGIYVPGITHLSGHEASGNYFQDWEKPAHIEFFEPGGVQLCNFLPRHIAVSHRTASPIDKERGGEAVLFQQRRYKVEVGFMAVIKGQDDEPVRNGRSFLPGAH